MPAITDRLSISSAPVKLKFTFLDSLDFPLGKMLNQSRSLHIEHVSPSGPIGREISPRSGFTGVPKAATFAFVRRWLAARKPDAGFVFTDVPATLLQALMFDARRDGREENLSVVCAFLRSNEPGVLHYCTTGSHFDGTDPAA